jgi:hypothetical protein
MCGLAGAELERQLDGAAAVGLLLDAYSSSGVVDAVVTGFLLAATRASVSAGSIGRTDSAAMGSVRARREERNSRV